MAKDTKVKMFTIEHSESTHKQEITESDYNELQPRIKEKYKITNTKEITTPAEIIPQ
mgnify:CR=1 FL=1